MPRIVWSKRLAKLLAFAMLVAVTCVGLGIWQIARLHQKQQFNARVRAGLAAPPQSLETLLPKGVDPNAVRYLRAEATGTYDVAHEVVLFGRTQNSQAGNHLLTPLVTAAGIAVIVDRGWVPLDVTTPGAVEMAPPTGTVRVIGVLLRSEGDVPGAVGGSNVPATTLAKIDLARIQSQVPYRIAPVYLLLRDQSPAQPSRFPEPAPLAPLDEGPHLSYAIQWFTFAAIALVGFVVLALREGRDRPVGPDDAER
jgi:surfeit locus 1 family protein